MHVHGLWYIQKQATDRYKLFYIYLQLEIYKYAGKYKNFLDRYKE